MPSRGAGGDKRSVLPPIVFEKDKRFLENVRRYILTEIEKVGCTEQGPPEEYYIIYRNAFDKIIEYVTAYKNILVAIKQEYETFIVTIKNGQRNAFFLHGRLKVLASEPTTLLYYRKRAMEFEDKIKTIEKNSAKIQNMILRIQNIRRVPSKNFETPGKTVNSAKPIPGLSIEESLKPDSLSKHLAQLDRKIIELKKESEMKYVPGKKKIKLEQELLHLLALRDTAEAKREKLKTRYKHISVIYIFMILLGEYFLIDVMVLITYLFSSLIIHSCKCYFCLCKISQDYHPARSPLSDYVSSLIIHRYTKILLVANVISACAKSAKTITLQDLLSQIMENKNDERALDACSKMAEDLLEYFERFSELLSSGQYHAAATSAANTYRGILLNEETLEKLEFIGCLQGRNILLMKYFETLINSSTTTGLPQNSAITLDAVKCALSEKHLNIVMHWVTQERLMFSEALGDVIYDYGKVEPSDLSKCLALAQIVYDRSGVHKKVALCLYEQGQIYTAVNYIRKLKHFSLDDYLFLLENCPATELISCLSQEWFRNPPLSSMGSTVLSLISTDHKKHGFQLLEEMSKKNTLEQMILNDTVCTVQGWKKIADTCAENKHEKLSQEILSVITSQDGVFESSPHEDEKDAMLMEHVF
ncbi:clathrin heavy chain linker domain-containing protein 1 [Rhea pennata]|uniref:clathrin heavy chain linker domain-containing protein 1 n=1 Tax=Rhea pennata TaxID=8795 RepID=UPI002E2773F7